MSDYNLKIILTNGETSVTLDPISGTPASVELTDLLADTDYEVEVILQRDGGNIDVASDSETFRTLSAIDENTPFYLEDVSGKGATFTLTKNGTPNSTDLSYSLDNENWTMFDLTAATNTVEVPANGRIYLRSSTGFSDSVNDYFTLNMSQQFSACGNIMNLLNYNNLDAELENFCFMGMFLRSESIIDASSLLLPATTLASDCYEAMFAFCTSLTTAPALPATTLLFSCYASMFNGCTSLTTAPALPATRLDSYCYQAMFNGCTSLKTAPELPATTLSHNCYEYMFQNCTNLQSVTTYCVDWDVVETVDWLKNAGTNVENPTIYCPADSTLKDYTDNNSGIPTGWTQVDL